MASVCKEIVEDIEDLLLSQEIDPEGRGRNGAVTVRIKKSKVRRQEALARKNMLQDANPAEEERDELLPAAPRSIVPGTQKIFLKTWGCTHNSSDSEYMAGLLASYGYHITNDKYCADLWLLNSCTVKSPAEDHFRNEIEAAQKLGVPVVATGCVPQGAPKSGFLRGLSIIGVQQIDRVVEVVEQTLNGNTVRLLGTKKSGGKKLGGAPLALPKIRRNPLIEIIAINTGCLNQCTYCKTKHARGELGSYPPEEIVARAVEAFSEGVVELWLTSEDTGAYGRDIGTSLPQLLKALIPVIPEGAMMRVGMTNPPYILDHLEEMAGILSHPRVYSFLHCPVQSGSDAVLTDMKREYSRKDFERVVNYLNANVEGGISIATDIICGFPTESEEDFEETLTLVAEHKFPSLFINQFFPRPGTPAALLPRINPKQVKDRTRRLTEYFHSYECYQDLVGTIQTILVTEVAHDGVSLVGHTKRYEQVLIAGDESLMGKRVEVEIISASKYSMKGVPLAGSDKWVSLPKHITYQRERQQRIILTRSISFLGLMIILRFIWVIFTM